MHCEQPKKILLSPVFVAILCLLLLNDFLLKATFHNWLTGKLSDFAGLFVFPLFLSALCPRFKKAIYALTAILFCLWKSPYSQPLIEAWNGFSLLSVSRVVDASDIIALSVLPISYLCSDLKHEYAPRFGVFSIALLSVFAFAATSFSTELEYGTTYKFEESKIDLIRKVYHLTDLNHQHAAISCESNRDDEHTIQIEIPSEFCYRQVSASIVIAESEGTGTITLKKMRHRCPKGKDDRQQLIAIFEKEFVAKIKEIALDSAVDQTIAGAPSSPDRSHRIQAGPLYLVIIGDVPEVNIKDIAMDLNAKYRLRVAILPPIALTDDLRQPGFPTSRPIAARLIEAMKRAHPDIEGDSRATTIGITEDMNAEGNRRFELSYQSGGRFSVVAIASLNPTSFCEPENKSLLGSRLQKVLAGNIGTLCYHLGPSDNPRSVLYRPTDCVHELDKLGTEF